MSTAAIQALLEESDAYPKPDGTVGFQMTRDQLIALLQECSTRVPIGVIPNHYEPTGDGTSFRITVYATFSRTELDMPTRKR